jgi:hypothetical protein
MISKEDFETCLAGASDSIQETARKYPAYQCYRSTKNARCHYLIGTYYAPQEGGAIRVVLVHGRDSTLPGVKTFGEEPEQLVVCNCGAWGWPTPEQVEERKRLIEAERHANVIRERHVVLEQHELTTDSESTYSVQEGFLIYADAMAKRDVDVAKYQFGMLARWFQRGGTEPDWNANPTLRSHFARWIAPR